MTTLRSSSALLLAQGLASAISEDSKPEAGGFDLEAGLVGPAVSEWLRKIAEQLDLSAVTNARTHGVLAVLDTYSMFDQTGTEVDGSLVVVKNEAVSLLRDLVAGTSFPTETVLEAVDSTTLIRKLRARGNVMLVWTKDDLEFLDEEDETQELSEPQLEALKQRFLSEIGGKLVDSLGSAGNEVIATLWQMEKTALIAQVIASSPATYEEADAPAAVESVRGG